METHKLLDNLLREVDSDPSSLQRGFEELSNNPFFAAIAYVCRQEYDTNIQRILMQVECDRDLTLRNEIIGETRNLLHFLDVLATFLKALGARIENDRKAKQQQPTIERQEDDVPKSFDPIESGR